MSPGKQIASDSDMETVLEEFKQRQVRRNSVGLAKYTCSVPKCEATFKRLDQLDRHEYHHTGIKKHACSYEGCDKTYSIVTHLKRHLRSTHERPEAAAQKTVKCALEDCGKMFISVSNMTRHMRETHECPRVYPCSYCSAKFSQKLKLKRHEIREHTLAYPFSCSKCLRGFYQEWQCQSHEPTCKQYECPGCPQKFNKWTLYTKHCRDTLHGRNRHKCERCDSIFDKPSDLKRHIETKHQEVEEKEASAASFTCTEEGCGKSYSYLRNLRQHMLSAHSGRRFECQTVECGRCFSSAQNLAKHLLRDHKDGKKKKDTKKGTAEKLKSNPRKRRRDAGRSKHSRLSKLACLQLDKDDEEAVRERQPVALEKVTKSLIENPIEELLAQTLQDEEEVEQE
ncbi:transcription factor IIIA [Drosophila eugracilis]|uniref:transcription factor IIIA n=1 Tax=Drosophila eugracilis TaxID=29029 RepID=UPI0007E7D4E8|nr:transcription factor IIIA [Drosophila eugracilis]XP_017064470.1 transcription factor IIIA [Drosophila eugracilis]